MAVSLLAWQLAGIGLLFLASIVAAGVVLIYGLSKRVIGKAIIGAVVTFFVGSLISYFLTVGLTYRVALRHPNLSPSSSTIRGVFLIGAMASLGFISITSYKVVNWISKNQPEDEDNLTPEEIKMIEEERRDFSLIRYDNPLLKDRK